MAKRAEGEGRGAGDSAAPIGGSPRAAEVLLGLGKTIASTLDLDQVLERILDGLSLVVPCDSASLWLLDGKVLELRAARGFADLASLIGFRLVLDSFALDRFVIESGTPLVVDDVWEDPRWRMDDPAPESSLIRGWMGIPLTASGDVIGMLGVDSYEPGHFGQSGLIEARAFADLAAVAVRNARLFAETRRRLKELDAVNRIGAVVASGLDVDSLCVKVGRALLEIFGTGVVYVALYDEEEGKIRLPFYAVGGRQEPYPPFPYGRGLTSRVIAARKTVYIATDARRRIARLGGVDNKALGPPRSWLGVPISFGDKVLGVLSVQSFERERAFGRGDVRLLATIASTVGSGLQNARLLQEARRRAYEASALAEAGREISESLDLDEVLRRIAERARALLTEDTAAVYLLEADGTLRPVVAVGVWREAVLEFPIPPGEGVVGRVAASRRGEIVNDAAADEASLPLPGKAKQDERLMAAPLVSGGSVIGVMGVSRGPGDKPFLAEDLAFLEALSRQASVAIQNARLHSDSLETASRIAALYETARAAEAEAEEANRLKSRFLANMSHELRTPLNSIINFAYLIQAGTEGESTPGQSDLLARIEEAGRHLLGLINDMLDLSKIEAGRMELNLEELDIVAVARGVLATAAGLVNGAEVELRDELPEGLPPALADRTRIRQVFLNLVSNAAKFTSSGHIAVRARAEAEEIVVEVEDTGIGMRTQDIPSAFIEFVQLDSDLDRRAGGSGLGLPLARRFIELHGGRIWVRSAPGEGAVFSFSLPRADAPRSGSAPRLSEP